MNVANFYSFRCFLKLKLKIAKAFLFLLLALRVIPVFSQSASEELDIEKKYSFIEIWGLKEQSRKDFLTEITSYPEGICQQSLRKMGYLNGNKIPLNGKLLITLRSSPDYRKSGVYKSLKAKQVPFDEQRWSTLLNAQLGFYEKQQLPYFLKPLSENDKSTVDSIFNSLSAEMSYYGIQLNKQKIMASYTIYKEATVKLTKQDVLDVLYLSDNDTLIEAAAFVAINFIKTGEDLLDFLPLLLKQNSNIQITISQFLNDYNGKIMWDKHMNLLPALLNNPNPFKAILVLNVLDKTGFEKSDMYKLRLSKLITLKEILQSDAIPSEKNFVLLFLNKYSSEPIETSPEVWIDKL